MIRCERKKIQNLKMNKINIELHNKKTLNANNYITLYFIGFQSQHIDGLNRISEVNENW